MSNILHKFFSHFSARPALPLEQTSEHLPDVTLPLSADLPPVTLMTESTIGVVANKRARLTLGIAQDAGKVRQQNEDALLVFTGEMLGVEVMPNFGLFIVADGIGGHLLGERASSIAARSFALFAFEQILPTLLVDSNIPIDIARLSEIMNVAARTANAAVLKNVPNGGTTLTAALVIGDQVLFAHVGDSRGYIITDEGIEQVTRDHSLVQRLKELGQISDEEAAVHPQRNVIYKAIGNSEDLEVDIISRRLSPGAILLLCSDGLWGQVNNIQMTQIVQEGDRLQAAAEALVAAANMAGGPDNITAVLVQYPG
jgi:serine/threonine protein phosphatase PrpC